MAFTPLTRYPNNGTVNVLAALGSAAPATVPANGSWVSPLLPAGFGGVSAAVTSDQAGAISIQRYADLAGTIPVGPLATQALTANQSAWTGFNDGLPFVSYAVTITNTSGTIANLSQFALLTGPGQM